MASPAVDVAWWLGQAAPGSDAPPVKPYLLQLRTTLENYDRWLWTNRNSSGCCGLYTPDQGADASTCCYHNASNSRCCPAAPASAGLGLLWSPSYKDTGEDNSDKYRMNKAPFQVMDLMGYSHDCARALARIARLLSDPTNATRWSRRADAVASAVKAGLWREELHAMFDRDSAGQWVTTLVHNNIRMMWHGAFSQSMADDFIAHHLMNTSEFWTNMPLPSIAINDPRFRKHPSGNDWSGPPQGLTIQRSIRALENCKMVMLSAFVCRVAWYSVTWKASPCQTGMWRSLC